MSSFFDEDTKEVVPLITCEDGKYTVCEETLAWLESLGEFGVIACAGKYRTGKSFLLNRLASAGSNVGFSVGDSVQACTKGLWVYKKAFEMDGKQLIFVDTEGIDALDANDTHDVRIFTLALLLSSTFIYNSMGPIDETALQTLSLMTRVTQNVKFDAESTVNDIAPHMPKFYWILRDFSLKLTNKDNDEITEDEYLEQALQSSADPNKNSVREAIRTAFPKRSLITLPRPSTVAEMPSQRMEDRLLTLSKVFVSGVDALRARLFKENAPMRAQDSTITGKMYAMLCRHYAGVVQSNAVPVIKDSWSLLASVQARDLKDALLAEATQKISAMKPKAREALEEDMKLLTRTIMDGFQRRAMKPIDGDVQQSLTQQLAHLVEDATRRLEINIAEQVETSLERLEAEIANCPENLAVILNNALAAFGEEHNNAQDFIKAWMVAANERALCRWIPRSLQSLSSERDERARELDLLRTQNEEDIQGLKDVNEENMREAQIRRSELEQLCESNKHLMDMERQDNLRLRAEQVAMIADIRMLECEQVLHNAAPSQTIRSDENDEALRLQDELSTVSIECAELRANLSLEKGNHDKWKRLYNDANERLQKAVSMQAQLEENWKSGIDKLRNEQQQMYEAQKADYDKRLQACGVELSKLQTQFESKSQTVIDLQAEKKRLDEKFTQEMASNEKMVTNLRETAQKYREQADQAQNRVLEIHKSMLDDLRMRDERAREQQSKHLKETSECQQRLTELTRENEMYKSEGQQMKRRLCDLETIEINCKRYKTSEREKDILIAQLQSEANELRATNGNMLQEREMLRKENMNMEGELSLLRAEKQMNEVRRAMNSNS